MLSEPASSVQTLAKLLPVASLQDWAAWVIIIFKLPYFPHKPLGERLAGGVPHTPIAPRGSSSE